jgi:hypothetical protein
MCKTPYAAGAAAANEAKAAAHAAKIAAGYVLTAGGYVLATELAAKHAAIEAELAKLLPKLDLE